jgi:hypothetical protein
LTVLQRVELELGLAEWVDRDGDAVLEREPSMPGDVVGVRVRLQHADDPNAFGLGGLEVLVDRICGVDDERLAGGGIPDQVRGAAEIVVDELAEQHEEEANTAAR